MFEYVEDRVYGPEIQLRLKTGMIGLYIETQRLPPSTVQAPPLLTDALGIKSEHNQVQADHYAKEGFVVVMPDIMANDPYTSAATLTESTADLSIIEQIKLMGAEAIKAFMTDMWLARHTPETTLPIILSILDSIVNEFADAVANGGGLYAVGYCFGGKYVALLAGEHPDTVLHGQAPTGTDEEKGMAKKGPLIKVGAFAHGTMITKEDLEAVKVPMCIVAVENDSLFPDEVREAGEKHFESAGLAHEVKVYPGVPHGFARVGNYEDQKIREAQGRAFEQMVGC